MTPWQQQQYDEAHTIRQMRRTWLRKQAMLFDTQRAMANAIGIDLGSLKKMSKKLKVWLPHQRRVIPKDLLLYYQSKGFSVRAASLALGCNRSTIYTACKKHGVKLHRPKKYSKPTLPKVKSVKQVIPSNTTTRPIETVAERMARHAAEENKRMRNAWK